jgi:hypothetical protein
MDLINRYINEVGRRLPKRMRADVETELHSLLLDSMEEHMAEGIPESGEVPEEIQVAVLKEFGSPQQVAQQYNPQVNYLIGPRLFEPYLITVSVVLGITFVAHLLGILTLAADPTSMADSLADALVGLFQSLQGGLGAITLVFALVERAIASSGAEKESSATWDPRKMPKIADYDRIKVSGLIIETVFLAFFLVMINFYPERIGISYVKIGAEFKMTSWLAPEFFQIYGPWLSAWWFLAIVLNIVVLIQGRWQKVTHLLSAALRLCGAFLFFRMATGPNFIATAPGGFWGEVAGIPDVFDKLMGQGMRSVLAILALVEVYSAAKILYRVFQLKPVTISLSRPKIE